MASRQTFFYGAAFHLTGDPSLLALARAGCRAVLDGALDRATGSVASWFDDAGRPDPDPRRRTAQDLAYAMLGPAMVFHLTGDADVRDDLRRMHAHLFGQYRDAEAGHLRWVLPGAGPPDEGAIELVAQLDPINAGMLLVAPRLPPADRARWIADMRWLADVMIRRFWWAEEHLFRGTLHDASASGLGSRHVDFGHTAKALWMIERVGRLAGDRRLVDFATTSARAVLQRAFLPAPGTWASRPRADGSLDAAREWWIYCELDQTAATLALADPSFAAPLPRTMGWWLRHAVDRRHGEVWGRVDAEDRPGSGPKIHHWKNGYHSAEHALIGAITADALRGRPVMLHFATAEPAPALRPYLFSARSATEVAGPRDAPAVRRVRFDGLG